MSGNKWLILGLIVSLGANIGLIGFVAGRASTTELGRGGLDPTLGIARILPRLPEARHDALRPLFRAHMHSVRPSIREIRRSQRALADAILAEPFSAADVEVALDDFRKHLAQSQVTSHGSFVTLVEQLTSPERKLLVEVMHAGPRHRRRPPDHGADRKQRRDNG